MLNHNDLKTINEAIAAERTISFETRRTVESEVVARRITGVPEFFEDGGVFVGNAAVESPGPHGWTHAYVVDYVADLMNIVPGSVRMTG